MLLGLNDFLIDMFLVIDDSEINLYYSDFETIPELATMVPLGSFDDETESLKWISLEYQDRLDTGVLFMERDRYIIEDPNDKFKKIQMDLFYREFSTLPEVTDFFDQYKEICRNWGSADYPIPESWIGWDKAENLNWWYESNNAKYIDWNNYPNWCQECAEYTYDPKTDSGLCANEIPIDVMPPEDLYFVCVVYFNGIYRVNPEHAQDFGVYQMLTDIDFEQNKYSMIVDIKRFFTLEFQWFLQTIPGMIPFGCDYGTHIKRVIQTKNTEIQRIEIENEINFFIYNFNIIWGELVQVEEILINSRASASGGDEWIVEVQAKVKQERLIYRIEG